MRVLVTGSSGHTGSAVAARLAREVEVAGVDLKPGPNTTHVGHIADLDLVRPALRQVDAVVHTAALHAPHVTSASPQEFQRINVDATRSLLKLAARGAVRRFVLTSTTLVYGCTSRAGTGIERRIPGLRSAFEHRRWPLPSRIDRIYGIDSARRILGYAPRHEVLEFLRAGAA
jgi:UDP-glucose 4-epimerase